MDRLIVKEGIRQRLSDSLETVMTLSGGLAVVDVIDGDEFLFSQNYACPHCGISIEEMNPRMFSFNTPYGACEACDGLGTMMEIDPSLVLPDGELSLAEGALVAPGWNMANGDSIARMYLSALAKHYGFDLKTPVKDLDKEVIDLVLYGTKGEKIKMRYDRDHGSGSFTSPFEGIIPNLQRRYRETQSQYSREEIESLMSTKPCPKCGGARLRPESLAVTVGGINIDTVTRMPIREALNFFRQLQLSETDLLIARQIQKELQARLQFLVDVGLDYLTLSRSAASLSPFCADRRHLIVSSVIFPVF